MAVQVVIGGAVQPRQPDEAEHHCELPDLSPGNVLGQGVSGASHNYHVDEVVEQLEEADGAVLDYLAVGPGWTPETLSEFSQHESAA